MHVKFAQAMPTTVVSEKYMQVPSYSLHHFSRFSKEEWLEEIARVTVRSQMASLATYQGSWSFGPPVAGFHR